MPTLRTTSATDAPSSACFTTATICSTENRFRFMAYRPWPSWAIMPETRLQFGWEKGEPIKYKIWRKPKNVLVVQRSLQGEKLRTFRPCPTNYSEERSISFGRLLFVKPTEVH